MAVFKCKMCGGNLEIAEGATVATCDYCGTKQTLPKLSDEARVNLYDRANHFRRNDDFDKAMSIYETILNEDKTDAEAYWSLVLCKYGIEYVEDPKTHKRTPTCNRTQFTSVFADEDYKSALENADEQQRIIYEQDAKAIDKIQKGILAISQKEEPFDVFICYKETDANGRRTKDSVLAQELYYQLVNEGYKVFFSRLTLEDKLGQEYEPYIFAGLNSAKVMVVVGTNADNFNSVWVRNEWSRYLTLIKGGADKHLIPAYKDIDPYDLPEEFSHLQAQDMSKLGFAQDLIRGIEKLVNSHKQNNISNEKSTSKSKIDVDTLLERALLCIEDEDYKKADSILEKVLNSEPKNTLAYVCKVMIELNLHKMDDFLTSSVILNSNKNFKHAIEFAVPENKKKLLYFEAIALFNYAMSLKEKGEYQAAANVFNDLKKFNGADVEYQKCQDLLLEKNEELKNNKKDLEKEYDRVCSEISYTNDQKQEMIEKKQSLFEEKQSFELHSKRLIKRIQKIESNKKDPNSISNILVNIFISLVLSIPFCVIGVAIFETFFGAMLCMVIPWMCMILSIIFVSWYQKRQIMVYKTKSINYIDEDANIEKNISLLKNKIEQLTVQKDTIVQQIKKIDCLLGKNTNFSSHSYEEPNNENDEMLNAAIEVVIEAQMASTTFLQRKLKLGYARAARLMDGLEEKGIIGPYEGLSSRKVLITKMQFETMNL